MFLATALSSALTFVSLGCLPGGGLGASFVDNEPSTSASGASPGERCQQSSDCDAGLRCLQYGFQKVCVSTCDVQSGQEDICGADVRCMAASNSAEGWCDPGIAIDLEDLGIGDAFGPSAGDTNDDDDDDGGVEIDPADPDNDDSDDGGDDGETRPVPVGDDSPPATGGDNDGLCGSSVEDEVFRYLNQARAENGLRVLSCHADLGAVARLHSEDMDARGYFDHTNPDGDAPWDRLDDYGVEGYSGAGENIAYGYPTPAGVHEGWMDSPGHRANILGEWYTHVGVGAHRSADGLWYWTQVFASF